MPLVIVTKMYSGVDANREIGQIGCVVVALLLPRVALNYRDGWAIMPVLGACDLDGHANGDMVCVAWSLAKTLSCMFSLFTP